MIEPAEGRLTGADTGKGRLPDPGEIFALACDLLARRGEHGGSPVQDLAGLRVVVSAGGTREYLDPVRFIGNRSSGRQGYALARTAAARGAEVTLVAANVGLPDPAGVKVVHVETTAQLQERVLEAGASRRRGRDGGRAGRLPPGRPWPTTKIKKSDDGSAPEIRLTQNPDILAGLVADATPRPHRRGRFRRRDRRRHRFGDGARAGQARPQGLRPAGGQRRRRRRRVRLPRTTRPSCSPRTVASVAVPLGSKAALAHVIWDRVLGLLVRPLDRPRP